MSISGVGSGVGNSAYLSTIQKELQQRLADFRALQDAMRKGDTAAAKKAYDSLQQSATLGGKDPSGQLFGPNDQLNDDFKSLGDALDSGNIDDARKAFAKLQNDMQAARNAQDAKARHHHHHNQSGVTINVTESVTITAGVATVPGGSSNDNDSGNGDTGGSAVTGVLNITA
jgi:hypothetical protein